MSGEHKTSCYRANTRITTSSTMKARGSTLSPGSLGTAQEVEKKQHSTLLWRFLLYRPLPSPRVFPDSSSAHGHAGQQGCPIRDSRAERCGWCGPGAFKPQLPVVFLLLRLQGQQAVWCSSIGFTNRKVGEKNGQWRMTSTPIPSVWLLALMVECFSRL